MTTLLQQIKQRRLSLGLKQKDMFLLLGMSRQQFQRLEQQGNPRLDTLALVAKGLKSELMLIPTERLAEVNTILGIDSKPLSDDPWQGLLGSEAEDGD